MGACATVANLAEALSASGELRTPRHKMLVDILKIMPQYYEMGDLSAWETAFQAALEEKDDESDLGNLIWEIFEFGRHNLYMAFDPDGTKICYHDLIPLFGAQGLERPVAVPEFKGW